MTSAFRQLLQRKRYMGTQALAYSYQANRGKLKVEDPIQSQIPSDCRVPERCPRRPAALQHARLNKAPPATQTCLIAEGMMNGFPR